MTSYSSMKILKRMADSYGIPVKITFNAHYYQNELYPYITKIVNSLMDIGFETFIIADLALVIYLREAGIKCTVHFSGEIEAINHRTIQLLNQFEVSRYVFPRKIPIANMEQLINGSGVKGQIEFEAFILNALCSFSGGFCNSLHCDELLPACYIPQKTSKLDDESNIFPKVGDKLKSMEMFRDRLKLADPEKKRGYDYPRFGNEGCGVCKIRKLMDIGVTHLKVVGRGYVLEYMIEDIKIMKSLIRLANEITDPHEYEVRVKAEIFNNRCPAFCYYPD